MVKEMEVYQFKNYHLPLPFYFPHMFFNSSSLFVLISILILQYNMYMKRHIKGSFLKRYSDKNSLKNNFLKYTITYINFSRNHRLRINPEKKIECSLTFYF
jgi:hypothetical protein